MSLQEPRAEPDRLTALLDVGSALAAAVSFEDVETAVESAGLLLLHGDRCRLVRVGPDGSPPSAAQEREEDTSLTRVLGRRALRAVGPVVAGPAESRLLRPIGVRSALAAPVPVHGEAGFCLYVTHGRQALLFGEEEVRLAGFVASLAGAALERLPDAAVLGRNLAAQRAPEDELWDGAFRDPLTGLPNRTLFLERTQQALERAQRVPAPLVVGFLDLDDFKAVNDTYGHHSGDELLVEMSRRLAGCIRPTDTLARLGADEFALLLEDTGLDAAHSVVERMLAAAAAPATVEGDEVVVSVSVGLAEAGSGAVDPDRLLMEADTAMSSAKQRGKHRYETFAPTMRNAMQGRSRLRAGLERALSGDQFRLHYQPITALDSGLAVGVEALLRWKQPGGGLLLPSEFVGFAEESGQILRIGAWVLRNACTATAQLDREARVSVNVSGRQLRSPSLLTDVERALALSGLHPSRLILEITETSTLGTAETQTRDVVKVLRALKGLGIRIALDDFGTGFSPLSHLRRFPVDLLKIDRSFVAGMTTSDHDEAIVRGVINLAHDLGVRVVAEGVELPAQLDALTALGCDYAQGYLLSRPVEMSALSDRPLPPPPRTGDERQVSSPSQAV